MTAVGRHRHRENVLRQRLVESQQDVRAAQRVNGEVHLRHFLRANVAPQVVRQASHRLLPQALFVGGGSDGGRRRSRGRQRRRHCGDRGNGWRARWRGHGRGYGNRHSAGRRRCGRTGSRRLRRHRLRRNPSHRRLPGIRFHSGAPRPFLHDGQQFGGQQLQRQTGGSRTRHRTQRAIRAIGQTRQTRQTENGRLLQQRVRILNGFLTQRRRRGRATQNQDQQIAQALQQILHEPLRVVPADDDLFDSGVQRSAILLSHGTDHVVDEAIRGEAQQRGRQPIRDHAPFGAGYQLIENRQGVAHGSAAGAHRQTQDTRFGGHLLLVAHLLQIRTHDLRRH